MMTRPVLLTLTLPLALLRLDAQPSAWMPAPAITAAPAGGTRPSVMAPSQWGDAMPTRAFSARYPQDPADSVYKEARSLLNRGEWRRAATMFDRVAGRTPASAYAADALYWQAFALYRIGGMNELREALAALDARKSRFPRAGNADDAESLTTRVAGALASRGDAAGTRRLQSTAAAGGNTSCDSEELSVRASALSTLMRNDPAAATPILSKVLDRRDECSVTLRKSAVSIIGRKDDAASRRTLMDVAKNDPDASVRGDAIGYLAEANTDEVATTLDGIVRDEQAPGVQRSAVRALGNMTNPRAKAAIRALVERTAAPERLRIDAIATFDRRAGISSGFNYSFSCDGGSCIDRSSLVGATASIAPMPPTPPTPAVAAARPAPAPAPRPMAQSDESRAAIAEARAEAMADARASARARAPMAISFGGDGVYSPRDDDRRISSEDAAWLRGVYPRLETDRLKSAAASVLARAGDEATSSWLASMISREDEPAEVRANILQRLGREMPIAQLGRLYDGASSRSMRSEIVQVLGRRDEPAATDKLIEIVRNGTDPQLRRSAISALNNKKDPRTTQLLLELIDK